VLIRSCMRRRSLCAHKIVFDGLFPLSCTAMQMPVALFMFTGSVGRGLCCSRPALEAARCAKLARILTRLYVAGAEYADKAVKFFKQEVEKLPIKDDFAALTKDEKSMRDALFWKVLNFGTVGGLGGSTNFSRQTAFAEAHSAFTQLQHTRRARRPNAIMCGIRGSELFVSTATLDYLRALLSLWCHCPCRVDRLRRF